MTTVEIVPLALRIMSEPKAQDDMWANGVEAALRATMAAHSVPGVEVITRVFCSGQGCLLYVESTQPKVTEAAQVAKVIAALRDSPWATTYNIKPRTFYVFATGKWDLILIDRRPVPVHLH